MPTTVPAESTERGSVQRETLRKRSKDRCEIGISRECTGKFEHSHHRKMRSQGGTDRVENILAVDPFCHDWIHAHPEVSYALGWLVKSHDDDLDVPWYPFSRDRKLTREEKSGTVTVERMEKPRNRVTWSMKVPKDQQEDGMENFETLLHAAGKMIAPELGLSLDKPPPFQVLCGVLYFYITSMRGQA